MNQRDPHWPSRFGTLYGNPDDYEAACLDAARKMLLDRPKHGPDVVVQDVELAGQYPSAQIVVRLLRRGRPEVMTWEVYEDLFSGTRPPEDPFEPPPGVAQGLLVDVLEGYT
ncbi:MAG TPA: hypothetical protein VK501_10955 [Baekduia sp.]|uniref:hypothetical protein n=1 Tax=Baekduia sp. TaxID=2600305 RepID=UPI002BE0C726|nr:hypothetical protein [Baekduia sp.]HMJ34425.1 hypothetical protein [Baekduia sp.]